VADNEVWHILPVEDIEEHDEHVACKCDPRIEVVDNGDILIIHNSFDGREYDEYDEYK